MKSLFSSVFGKLFLATTFLLLAAAANARPLTGSSPATDTAAIVRYLGTQDDMLVFNVSYSNPEGARFLLTVKDQDGNQLFQSLFSEKTFFKQFRLPKSEKDRVVFIFRDNRDVETVKAFDVNVNSRYVREVAIRKVD